MFQKRIIPILLMDNDGLVKTKQFKDPIYVGDPLNAVRIFNTKLVDELIILDIGKSRHEKRPDFDFISRIVSECFMPLGYGGGIQSFNDAIEIFALGVEKIVLQSAVFSDSSIIQEISRHAGRQSVSIAIDVIRDTRGSYYVYHAAKRKIMKVDLLEFLIEVQAKGAGEILITSIDREGTFSGYDLNLISYVRDVIDVPLIINGGASKMDDFEKANLTGADAMAAGSMFVFYKNRDGVLLNYPISGDYHGMVGE
jgi:cyclase